MCLALGTPPKSMAAAIATRTCSCATRRTRPYPNRQGLASGSTPLRGLLTPASLTSPASSTRPSKMSSSGSALRGTRCAYSGFSDAPHCKESTGTGDFKLVLSSPHGYDYVAAQGWSCSECAPEHYRDDDTTCKKCNDYVWIIYTIGLLAALVLVPLIMRVSKSHGFMSINIFVGTMQVWGLLVICLPPTIICIWHSLPAVTCFTWYPSSALIPARGCVPLPHNRTRSQLRFSGWS